MLNIGLWGPGPSRYEDFVKLNRDLEHKLRELGGMKWPYTHTYYSESEFWEIYDREWYEALRRKYNATSLPSVYEKVRVNVEEERRLAPSWQNHILGTWPLNGFWGIRKAIESGSFCKLGHRNGNRLGSQSFAGLVDVRKEFAIEGSGPYTFKSSFSIIQIVVTSRGDVPKSR